MNVLVTGAGGFVGRALVAQLAAAPDCVVRAVVRRPTDALPASVAQVVVPDVTLDGDWGPAFADVGGVVHLAARVHVMSDRAADPLAEYRRVNVAGTLVVARHAAKHGVRRFVFVSTVKVNGEESEADKPFIESDAPAPKDPYGQSKSEAEAALFAYGAESGMEIVVVRPTLVYGPGVKANFLAMARWLQRGIPLPLGAIRHNRRSLVAMDNLVDLLVICLRHPAAANQVFFAADGEDLSTAALMLRTAAALGVRARLVPIPSALLETAAMALGKRSIWQRLAGNLQVDITKARTRLGWNPPVSVDEGLRRAVRPLAHTGTA
jgi:UDP-N-acetyl-alpha-D-quinovosamine dehydrogenase